MVTLINLALFSLTAFTAQWSFFGTKPCLGAEVRTRTAPEFEWCQPLPAAVAPYNASEDLPAFRIRLGVGSGACSTLIAVLNAVMYAMAERRNFFLDESVTRLKGDRELWYGHYFQSIGTAFTAPYVDIAYSKNVTNFVRNATLTINAKTLRRLDMKRSILRQAWQFQPWLQAKVCQLVHGLQLFHPYIAMFIRLGDKLTLEHRSPVPLHDYVDTLHGVSLNGVARTVFVAMDDCRVLQTLVELAPAFKFVSLCHVEFSEGFHLYNVSGSSNMDAHFLKFFGELTIMAEADTLIGDRQSNVYFWAAYMRRASTSNASLIDVRQYPYVTADVA